MYKLLSINNTDLIVPIQGSFSINKEDKVNEYETEDGGKTIEVIRSGIISGSVSYSGLTQNEMNLYDSLLTPVSRLKLFDPMTGTVKEFLSRISGKSANKLWHDDNITVWSFAFNFEEL